MTHETVDVSRYRQLRALGRKLNEPLVRQVPQTALLACAKELGLSRSNTLILDFEDELSVLIDYCLLSHRHAGKTRAQLYKERHPPSPGSAAAALGKVGRAAGQVGRWRQAEERAQTARLAQVLAWGGLRNRRGNMMVNYLVSCEDGVHRLQAIDKRRRQRGYSPVGNLWDQPAA